MWFVTERKGINRFQRAMINRFARSWDHFFTKTSGSIDSCACQSIHQSIDSPMQKSGFSQNTKHQSIHKTRSIVSID
jgi:hypothetical protein